MKPCIRKITESEVAFLVERIDQTRGANNTLTFVGINVKGHFATVWEEAEDRGIYLSHLPSDDVLSEYIDGVITELKEQVVQRINERLDDMAAIVGKLII